TGTEYLAHQGPQLRQLWPAQTDRGEGGLVLFRAALEELQRGPRGGLYDGPRAPPTAGLGNRRLELGPQGRLQRESPLLVAQEGVDARERRVPSRGPAGPVPDRGDG